MESGGDHRLSDPAARDPGAEPVVEGPGDEQGQRDGEQDEPLPPSEQVVEGAEHVMGEFDGPHERGGAEADEYTRHERGDE